MEGETETARDTWNASSCSSIFESQQWQPQHFKGEKGVETFAWHFKNEGKFSPTALCDNGKLNPT